MSNSAHRVVITGIGLITPLGNSGSSSWEALLKGTSGFNYDQNPLYDTFPCRIVGTVKNEQELLTTTLSAGILRKTDRFIQFALLASIEALKASGLSEHFFYERDRVGTYVGVGIGGLKTIADSARTFDALGIKSVSPFMITRAICSEAPGFVSMHCDLQGPMSAFSNACASGADAIGAAYWAIVHGKADAMVAGGSESCINELSLASFGNMRVLSHWKGEASGASRPFSGDRSGFVIAEGAGIVVLEREDLARKRSAPIIAEIVGYGSSSDAYHITAMHPEARGAIKAMKNALADAKISADAVNYINAHGTATEMNDALETYAIKQVFGEQVNPQKNSHTVISSSKSMTGHMLGATGAVEVAFSALSLRDQIVPPTMNLDVFDPACDLDYVPLHARGMNLNYALSNSFGFGGGNAVIVLKKYSH